MLGEGRLNAGFREAPHASPKAHRLDRRGSCRASKVHSGSRASTSKERPGTTLTNAIRLRGPFIGVSDPTAPVTNGPSMEAARTSGSQPAHPGSYFLPQI